MLNVSSMSIKLTSDKSGSSLNALMFTFSLDGSFKYGNRCSINSGWDLYGSSCERFISTDQIPCVFFSLFL